MQKYKYLNKKALLLDLCNTIFSIFRKMIVSRHYCSGFTHNTDRPMFIL